MQWFEGSFRYQVESATIRYGNTWQSFPKQPRDGYPDILSQAPSVIHCDSNLLLGPQVALGGLDGGVAEQEFDLFQVSSIFAAKLGASTPEIMGTKMLDSNLLR